MAKRSGGVPRPTFPVPKNRYDEEDESRFRRLVEQFATAVSGAFASVSEDIETVEESIPGEPPTEVLYEAWGGTSPIEVSDSSTSDKTTTHTLTGESVNGAYEVKGAWYIDNRGSSTVEYQISVGIDPDGASGFTTYAVGPLGPLIWDDIEGEVSIPLNIPIHDADLEAGGKIRLTLSAPSTTPGSGDESTLRVDYIIGL